MRSLPVARRAALALALLAACRTPAASRPSVAASDPLRMLVYNIHAGRDDDGADNLARVADLVRETGADVALLQEVDVRTARSGGVDQAAELARRTGFHVAFGSSLDYQGGEYGIAVLSRWPMRSHEVVPLPTDPPATRAGGLREPRIALRAAIDAPFGPLEVLNTHIDASRGETFRLQEAAALVAATRAARLAGARRLAGGDLNAEPDSRTQATLRAGGWRDLWPGCGDGPGFTYSAARPVKRIDYLYALGEGVACERAEVLASDASDHRPVLFHLRLR